MQWTRVSERGRLRGQSESRRMRCAVGLLDALRRAAAESGVRYGGKIAADVWMKRH